MFIFVFLAFLKYYSLYGGSNKNNPKRQSYLLLFNSSVLLLASELSADAAKPVTKLLMELLPHYTFYFRNFLFD